MERSDYLTSLPAWHLKFIYYMHQLSQLWFLLTTGVIAFHLHVLWINPACDHLHKYRPYYILVGLVLSALLMSPYLFCFQFTWSTAHQTLILSSVFAFLPVRTMVYVLTLVKLLALIYIAFIAVAIAVVLCTRRTHYHHYTHQLCENYSESPRLQVKGILHPMEPLVRSALCNSNLNLWNTLVGSAVSLSLHLLPSPWQQSTCALKVAASMMPALMGIANTIIFLFNPALHEIRREPAQAPGGNPDQVVLEKFPTIASDPYHVVEGPTAIDAQSNYQCRLPTERRRLKWVWFWSLRKHRSTWDMRDSSDSGCFPPISCCPSTHTLIENDVGRGNCVLFTAKETSLTILRAD
ncbi:hypothetical protein H4R34_005584 [Dimargaris verticillata]|uniref:Uncharacterized protein n=1 Tax=Dimargaris verticillata TaxID=2761393 RepID=A0A9W8B0B8_9FUNG|nr:hypothetical protein H4R34_005584 [Dimargaris verticillata]